MQFDPYYWMPGMPVPRLLPARPVRSLSLKHVNDHTLIGVGTRCRLFVVKDDHDRRRGSRYVLCLVHDRPQAGFFRVPRDAYRIG